MVTTIEKSVDMNNKQNPLKLSDRLMAYYLGLILIGAIGWIGDHLLRVEVATKKAR